MNDKLGDCTCAAAGHMIQTWTACVGREVIPTNDQVVAAYSGVTGYDGTPRTDNGANELDLLNYWRKSGIAGHQIEGYVGVDPKNADHVKQTIWLFGGAYIGLALPETAQSQRVWDVAGTWNSLKRKLGGGLDPTPGSWGGHAVPVLAYDADGLICDTWGETQRMTWKFFDQYCDEAYAVLSPSDWLKDGVSSPAGVKIDALRSDLQALV